MLRKILALHLAILCSLGQADVLNDADAALKACDLTVEACKDTLQSYRDLSASQDKLIQELAKQRNEAIKEKESDRPLLPWWGWIIIGGASYAIIDSIRR